MNFIDVGAGKVDKYTEILSRFPNIKIFSIEPHPELFEKIINIKNNLNSESASRLFVLNEAISSNDGEATFYINNDAGTSSLLPIIQENILKWKYPLGRRAIKPISEIKVKTTTLNNIIQRFKINGIDFLNIDVQGNSLDVIKSMKLEHFNKTKQINVKVHADDLGFELYNGQCTANSVIKELKNKFFLLKFNELYSRNQEHILTFINEKLLNKKSSFDFLNN